MPEPTVYEIVLRGRASTRLLRPLLDDFQVEYTKDGLTRLVGYIQDPSHLHGVLTHLTAVGADLVSIVPVDSIVLADLVRPSRSQDSGNVGEEPIEDLRTGRGE